MNKDNETPCVLGFDELFEDGIFCGNLEYDTPMSKEEVDRLMQGVINGFRQGK